MSGENISFTTLLQQGLAKLNGQNISSANNVETNFTTANSIFDFNYSPMPHEEFRNMFLQRTGIDINQSERLAYMQFNNMMSNLNTFDFNGDGQAEDMSMIALQTLQKSQKAETEGRINVGDTSYLPGEVPEGFTLETKVSKKTGKKYKILSREEFDYKTGELITKYYPYEGSTNSKNSSNDNTQTNSNEYTDNDGNKYQMYILKNGEFKLFDYKG